MLSLKAFESHVEGWSPQEGGDPTHEGALTVVRNQKTWSRERQNRAPGSAPDLHETGSDADPTPCLLSRVVLGDGAMSSSPA